jgi:AbrB family looped-hinge helix DNA binding protein
MKYTTITGKGQVTIPASIRRTYGLIPGRKLAVGVQDGRIFIDPPGSIQSVRGLLKAEMQRQGTAGISAQSGDGWAAYVGEQYDSEP